MDEQINLKRKLNESLDESNQIDTLNKSDQETNPIDSTIDQKNDDQLNSPSTKKLKKGLYDNDCMSLSLIELKKVIDIRPNDKTAILEGAYNDERVLIFIEKLPFEEERINKLFAEPLEMKKIIQNDIYGSYLLEQLIENKIKTTIICPATEKHFLKYSRSKYVMIEETAELYKQITIPYLEENKFSIDWVYNILEHKQESERILYEDEDERNGFIILPDLKWDGINVRKLYLMVITRKRGIKSIRDLTADHLPLLKNIKEKSFKIVKEKYGIDKDELQIYFHYQPSYYHLHIHINPVHFEHPRLFIGSSHLLDTVITNLEIDSDYYKKATLTFRIKCSDPLNDYYKSKLNKYLDEEKTDLTTDDAINVPSNDHECDSKEQ